MTKMKQTRGLVLILPSHQVGTQIQFLSPLPLQPIATKDLAHEQAEKVQVKKDP